MTTIATAPAPDVPLAALDDLKAELQNASFDEPALINYLRQASSMAASYIGSPVLLNSYRDVLRLERSPLREILLGRRPVAAIDTIMANGQDLTDVVDPDSDLDPDAGILHAPAGCCRWHGRIIVTYRAGYLGPGMDAPDGLTVPALPPDISRAVLITARALFHAPSRGDPQLRSESEQGVGSTAWLDPDGSAGGMPVDAAAILTPYRAGAWS
ncbi:hypothetical protein ACMAUO_12780 [Gluconacetobacter sp. Hr-1-5]|uniref:hypothetical protein n=1 Tax=Gluconacetobacter sp. Hr-1-5 TaxID=3395370 RepID=UPI003B52BD09